MTRLSARHARRVKLRGLAVLDEGPDLSWCPWYLRQLGIPGYETGTCSFGCREQPDCMELGPEHPHARYIELGELNYPPITTGGATP